MRLCGARSGARGILRQPRAKARAVVPHTPQPMTRTRRSSILAAHAALGVAADEWRANADSVLGGYALRQGVAHDLAAGRIEGARARVTNFDWAQTRTARIGGARVEPDAAEATQPIEDTVSQLCDDYTAVARSVPAGDDAVQMWAAFMRERAHILRRGDEKWATNKILLQLAVEHADDSPVTQAAEAWLADGGCDWLWLRRARRVAHAVPDPCRRVFEGHTKPVNGAEVLASGEVLSWSGDGTLRLWDATSGACLAVLEGHTSRVEGALALPSGAVLSWSGFDSTLRVWDATSGACLAVLEGHEDYIDGARVLPSGEVLSWCDSELRLWDVASGELLRTVANGTAAATAPDLYHAWRNAVRPPAALDEATSSDGYQGGVTLLARTAVIEWHANGEWSSEHLLADGIVVATCDKHIAILQLHEGARRISLAAGTPVTTEDP